MATHALFHSELLTEDTLDVPALPLGDHLAHGLVLLHLVLLVPRISITITFRVPKSWPQDCDEYSQRID